MTVDPRFERSARLWLRAYPRRWRLRRADEMVALLADLALPGATRVDVRTAAGLVRSGWATRARTRPPLRYVLGYRLLDRRVPARYRGWVRDDLEGACVPLRVVVSVAVVYAVVSVLTRLLAGEQLRPPSMSTVAAMLGMSVGLLSRGPWQLRKQSRKHLVAEPGEELTADSLLFGMVPRERLTAHRTTGMLALTVAVAGVSTVVACVVAPGAPEGLLAVLGTALLVGVLGSVASARSLRRLVPERRPQPARRLVRPEARHVVLLAVIGVHPVGMAWIEGTGRTDLFLSVGFAVGALLFLPVLLVAWRAARSAPDDVALTDVVTIAMLARQPQVDRYCEGLVPAVVATD